MWALELRGEEEVDRESNCSNHHHASGRSQLCNFTRSVKPFGTLGDSPVSEGT
jgi:hypothetical protein